MKQICFEKFVLRGLIGLIEGPRHVFSFQERTGAGKCQKGRGRPPQRAGGKPRPTLHGAPLKQTRQIVKKKQNFAASLPTKPEV